MCTFGRSSFTKFVLLLSILSLSLSLSSHVIALQEVRNKRMREVERLMITWDEWEKSWEEESGDEGKKKVKDEGKKKGKEKGT